MKKIFLILLVIFSNLFSQEIDISRALQLIESGNIKSADTILRELKSTTPNDPAVIYLDAVLTKDGDEALKKYSTLLEKYPQFKFKDKVLYQIFSYYYSLGFYKKAETYLDRLKKEFPESEYVNLAQKNIPAIDEKQPAADNTRTIIEKPKSAEAKNIFTIQAGAFLNIDNAKKLKDKLSKEKFPVEISSKEIGGSVLNVVNVGRFKTEAETKKALSTLEKKYSIKGRVTLLLIDSKN